VSDAPRALVPPEMVQWPFIGVVALLVLLLLLTPALLAPASGPGTQAVLIVDRPSGNNTTRFYVESIQILRYASISIGFAHGLGWPPPATAAGLAFGQWTNVTDAVTASASDANLPDAVNVTVVYVDSAGATVTYVGVYAFGMVNGALDIVALTPELAGDAPASLAPGSAPQQLPLYLVPAGGSS
jgi:hypothetical protein